MDTTTLSWNSPYETALNLAQRLKTLRLQRNWSQATLAARAGVTMASYRRFETQGKASLDLVLKVALALSRLDDLELIFQPPPARSIQELERLSHQHLPRRGRQ